MQNSAECLVNPIAFIIFAENLGSRTMANKLLIQAALQEQYEDLQDMLAQEYVARQEEKLVRLNSKLAQVVIGVRRSGKSVLCLNVLKKAKVHFGYVNFDDERLLECGAEDLDFVLLELNKIYGQFDYLFMDEIQNIDSWYVFVNRLLRRGMHVLITGSNAKILGGELSDHLTGRHSKIELLPFSFREYCTCRKVDMEKKTTLARAMRQVALDKYLKEGGFPELLEPDQDPQYIQNLIEAIITQDIQKRHKLKYISSFKQLVEHVLNISPSIINIEEIQKIFNIKSDHTVSNYLKYMQEAYLIATCERYSPKSKLRIHHKKAYPIDVALMDQRDNALVGDNLGWRLETMVYLELLRRNRPLRRSVYYYSERSGEADFAVCSGRKVEEVYQVAYSIEDRDTRKRELNGLKLAFETTKCPNLWLINNFTTEEAEMKGCTAHVITAAEWLTGEYTE